MEILQGSWLAQLLLSGSFWLQKTGARAELGGRQQLWAVGWVCLFPLQPCYAWYSLSSSAHTCVQSSFIPFEYISAWTFSLKCGNHIVITSNVLITAQREFDNVCEMNQWVNPTKTTHYASQTLSHISNWVLTRAFRSEQSKEHFVFIKQMETQKLGEDKGLTWGNTE